MTRTVLGFRLTDTHPAPPLRPKRKIKKAVHRAAKKQGRFGARKWPFADMEIGESFFVSGTIRSNITAAAASFKDRSFATKALTQRGIEGYRVWRVQ